MSTHRAVLFHSKQFRRDRAFTRDARVWERTWRIRAQTGFRDIRYRGGKRTAIQSLVHPMPPGILPDFTSSYFNVPAQFILSRAFT